MRRLGVLVALAACGHGQTPTMGDDDMIVDAAFFPDAGDPCPGGFTFLSGELVDWDSANPGVFVGIFQALLTPPGQQMPIESTPPNGRLDICVPTGNPIVLDVDNPDDYLDGQMLVAQDALQGFIPISFRGIKKSRAQTFYQELGLTFDATKAQVVVFLAGDRASVSLDRTHAAVQAGNDDAQPGTFAWAAGDTGRYVLFPNIDVAQPTGTVTAADGTHIVPLVAGQLTMLAISFVFI
jgi:hypothetical protein